jgi:GDP-L-fucose synthase
MKKVLVTGGTGFIGKNLIEYLAKIGKFKVMSVGSKDYDLRDPAQVKRMLYIKKPDLIYHCAALVGGVYANMTMKGKFFYENIMMNTSILEEARLAGVEKVLLVGSGCVYPKIVKQPIKEKYLWDGYPEETNAPYAFAKKMMIVQSEAYKEQYGFNSITIMPGNVYGVYDNFHLEDAHVAASLIKKFSDAVDLGKKTVEVWGDGTPTRDFVYAPDLTKVMVDLMDKYNDPRPLNVSSGVEITIEELAHIISNLTRFEGDIIWQLNKPNGQPRRCFDCSKLESILGYKPSTPIVEGLSKTIEWYNKNKNTIRMDKK